MEWVGRLPEVLGFSRAICDMEVEASIWMMIFVSQIGTLKIEWDFNGESKIIDLWR